MAMERKIRDVQSENIAKHIWHDVLQKSLLPFRWKFDFSSIKTIDNGTAFRVEGKMKAWIMIMSNPNIQLFKVVINSDNGNKPIEYKNVQQHNVVSVIDQIIEHGAKYEEQIKVSV